MLTNKRSWAISANNKGNFMEFQERLKMAWAHNDSLLCVGLDPEHSRLPKHVLKATNPILEFNKQVIDATYDLVCAYKPQIAFYSAVGAEEELKATIEYIHQNYPKLIVILDSKRGDIGNTARLYASEAYDRYKADAVTVNPYLGTDSLEPFLERKDKGVVIVARTSNAGAKDLQDLDVGGQTLYEKVSHIAASNWNTNKNVMIVVGATYPKELGMIRAIVGDMPLLVPGIGAQGGDIEAAVKAGVDSRRTGMVINSSRAILYAGSKEDFAQAARNEARRTRDEINRVRKVVQQVSS